MKIIITGKGGQLATELELSQPEGVEVISLGIEDLDITDEQQVFTVLSKNSPDLVINASAYTAVDKAEEDRDMAFAVNELGAKHLADACHKFNSKMIHVSTDFVFDGKASRPYTTADKAEPCSVYGLSKLKGEQAVLETLGDRALVIRTAWLYSSHGHNFVKTMLKLMEVKDELSIVSDQVGTPTWGKGLAESIWLLSEKEKASGLYHFSDAGVASWYDFAVAIQEVGLELGLLNKAIPVKPIRTEQYPTPARRPFYGVMDKSRICDELQLELCHWRKSLVEMMRDLKIQS